MEQLRGGCRNPLCLQGFGAPFCLQGALGAMRRVIAPDRIVLPGQGTRLAEATPGAQFRPRRDADLALLFGQGAAIPLRGGAKPPAAVALAGGAGVPRLEIQASALFAVEDIPDPVAATPAFEVAVEAFAQGAAKRAAAAPVQGPFLTRPCPHWRPGQDRTGCFHNRLYDTGWHTHGSGTLRASRRPKAPSLPANAFSLLQLAPHDKNFSRPPAKQRTRSFQAGNMPALRHCGKARSSGLTPCLNLPNPNQLGWYSPT
jgi:hypothetical protein